MYVCMCVFIIRQKTDQLYVLMRKYKRRKTLDNFSIANIDGSPL